MDYLWTNLSIAYEQTYLGIFKEIHLKYIALPKGNHVAVRPKKMKKACLSFLERGKFTFFFLMAKSIACGSSLGQGSNPSYSCYSCGTAGSFNPLRQAWDQTCTSPVTRTTTVRFLSHCSTVGTLQIYLSLFKQIQYLFNICFLWAHNVEEIALCPLMRIHHSSGPSKNISQYTSIGALKSNSTYIWHILVTYKTTVLSALLLHSSLFNFCYYGLLSKSRKCKSTI